MRKISPQKSIHYICVFGAQYLLYLFHIGPDTGTNHDFFARVNIIDAFRFEAMSRQCVRYDQTTGVGVGVGL